MPMVPSYRNQSTANQLTGFYMRATLALNGLMMREFLTASTITFAKITNKKGPKMDPCGTQQVSKSDSEKVLF